LRLDAFLLADHSAVSEGKLYVNGGGVTRLNVPTIPFAIPSLSVIVRYLIEGPEDHREHAVGVRLETPSGVNVFPAEPVGRADVGPPSGAPDEEQFLQLSLNFGGVPIVELGTYVLSAMLNDEVMRRMTLPVVLVDGGSPQGPSRAERRRQERDHRRRRGA
jgi:hypothetical protein